MTPWILLAGLGCTIGGDPARDPSAGSLSYNVGSAFAPCNEAEIRFLAPVPRPPMIRDGILILDH